MRHAAKLSIALVALVCASCGGSDSEPQDRTVATSPGPTGVAGNGPKPGDGGPTRRDERTARAGNDADARFGEKVSFREKSFFGSRSQVVYFVAERGRPALDQAKECVKRNLGKAPSAYCFAFPSERAFRYSRVARRPPAGMKRPCWNAYWGKPRNRRAIGSETNPAAAQLKCPDASL